MFFFSAYGMTEASPVVFITKNSVLDNYLTVGPPIPNTSTRIVDPLDNTKLYGPGEVGEIQIKGPQVREINKHFKYVYRHQKFEHDFI